MSVVRILVVDDFKPWHDFIRGRLEDHQHLQVVGVASDGLEALRRVEELNPDLVLLDIGLPALNGIEAARQIRKLAPECKIIFLAGDSDSEIVRAALEAGGHGYVHKWEAATELLLSIERVFLGERYLSQSVRTFGDRT